MRFTTGGCRPALIMQMILVHIQTAYPMHHVPRDFLQHSRKNLADNEFDDPDNKHSIKIKEPDNLLIRNPKSGNQAHILSIDLSALRQDPAAHSTSRYKSPMNILGIDISVLSQNPDPNLPLAIVHPKNVLNGKSIMSYDFDPKYDRLPVVKTRPVNLYVPPPAPKPYLKPAPVLPVMHLPLKVMTTYHSILTNKKQDTGFQFDNSRSNDMENEQKYTANFLLHLLYQLSSHYKKANHNYIGKMH